MPRLSDRDCSLLASAYELRKRQVQDDALFVLLWNGSEDDLLTFMQARHDWSAASEYAPYYVADLRRAIQPLSSNGIAH